MDRQFAEVDQSQPVLEQREFAELANSQYFQVSFPISYVQQLERHLHELLKPDYRELDLERLRLLLRSVFAQTGPSCDFLQIVLHPSF